MRSGPRPTQRDVARRAGISMMSVSRVLNNSRDVSPQLRAKVERVMRELNYVPNQAAKVLATNQASRNIAILFDRPCAAVLEEMIGAGYPEAGRSQVRLAFIRVQPSDDPSATCATINALGVRGVILPPPLCDDARLRTRLGKAGIRSVAIACGDPDSPISTIGIDDWRAAYALTLHLIRLGHRRIGFTAGHRRRASARRRAGYEAALLEHGLEPDAIQAQEDVGRGHCAEVAADQALAGPTLPTAMIAADEAIATALVGVARNRGIAIPANLSLCAFSDNGQAQATEPRLTTVSQPMALMASWAIRQLAEELNAVERGKKPELRRVLFDHDIAHGESLAPPERAETFRGAGAAWEG